MAESIPSELSVQLTINRDIINLRFLVTHLPKWTVLVLRANVRPVLDAGIGFTQIIAYLSTREAQN